ncbi:MAG: MarR family transcriptional regulator [Phaeodactylibacter sp.]|nr:MarR family transcriptional regulator [Phaeodactylibacter sp.]MCB9275638.1 MarR family transcriptional regulator [Lewinellaceae bacterium]
MKETGFNPLDSIIFLANRVGRLLANEVRHKSGLDDLGLQPQHMGILVDLWQRDGVRQQDLAVSTIKDKGTIARALNALERDDVLVRVPDPIDKRTKRIFLTHRGRRLREQLLPQARQVEAEALSGLKPEELQACKHVLGHIYRKYHQ